MARIERFTAEAVAHSDKQKHALGCVYGIKMSTEELAEQIACGIRLGYFTAEEIGDLVLKTEQKVEEKISKLSDEQVAWFYAESLNDALIDLIRLGDIHDELW